MIILVLLVIGWFGLERRRFPGPPVGGLDAAKQALIAQQERLVGEMRGDPASVTLVLSIGRHSTPQDDSLRFRRKVPNGSGVTKAGRNP